MIGLGVVRAFLEHFLLGLSTGFEIAIDAYIAATDNFHSDPPQLDIGLRQYTICIVREGLLTSRYN